MGYNAGKKSSFHRRMSGKKFYHQTFGSLREHLVFSTLVSPTGK